ncbi:hypothetical protein [Streptomyces sp. NPDC005407]|uniref:hypothetical protein n=1 Tax=Streptomyces sp. NPDC005407 TaxID=3155340 RepID=UPI0033AE91A3
MSLPLDSSDARALARRVLAEDQRKPDDVDLFTPQAYSESTPMPPASGPQLSEDQTRRRLERFLREQSGKHSAPVRRALALFDSPDLQAKMPDPTLRAAYAAMVDTLWEPTIDHFLNSGRFTTATFGVTPNPDAIAMVLDNGDGTSRIVFNQNYSREHFALFIGVMGHEIMHDDNANSGSEEGILHGLTAMVHAQVVSRHPDLAYGGTELTQRTNTAVLAWLNSKNRDSPISRLVASTGLGVYPGGAIAAADFWSLFGDPSDSSPAPVPVFAQVLALLGLPGSSVFDKPTAETFGQADDAWLSYPDRVGLNVLLQTITVKEIARERHLPKDRVIRLLSLRNELDAIREHQSWQHREPRADAAAWLASAVTGRARSDGSGTGA